MTGSKDELRLIEDALIQSMLDASPEDTLAELREQGIDPVAGVSLIREMTTSAIATARKQRLAEAKAKAAAFRVVEGGQLDASERHAARARLEAMRSGGGSMMLAARQGKGSSERDEDSLVDDLARLERLRKDEGEP